MSSASVACFGRSGDSDLVGSNPGQVKPMTLKMILVASLDMYLALLGYGKDWLTQCQDNISEWDITLLGHGSSGLVSQ